MDPETGHVKWLCPHYRQQHDPDFIGNGEILVFDNNRDSTADGSQHGGSRIVRVKPETGEYTLLYPEDGSLRFYTASGGKFQLLGNGNLLIAECGRGRVFEVNDAGHTVWEWVAEPYDSEHVSEVLEGTRYDISREQIATWKSERGEH